MSIPKIAVGNPVLANLLMIAVIVFGTYAWFALPRELSPEVTLQTATVMTFYPGASPEEVEKLITVPIEDAIEEGVGKIDLMVSTSTEGRSVITIQFEEISDRDFDKQMQNLRSSVERVGDLPDDLPDDPRVQEVDISDGFPMLTVVVAGKRSETELKKIAEDLRDEILDIRNIASVRLAGVREREVWVELDPDRLAAYGLSSLDVMTALRADNLNLPAGTMGIGKSEFIVRTLGEYRSLAEIEDTIIRTARAGSPLRIRDIASVSDTFEKPRTLSRVDGEPSISMTIQKKKEGNTIALVKELRELVAERQPQMPDGVALSAVNDYSVILKERLGILQSNAGFGMVLVIAMLFALLGWRNAFFAAIGIPVAFMATFWFMHVTGYSLSGVALFGLILVVGIVVDDAIVVIENVARHLQMGKSPAQAAIDGAEEVWLPVLAASLTTIGAFGPLMFMSGVPGQFMRIVPIVAILVLVASLMESFFILPAHIAEWGKGASGTERRTVWFEKIQWTYVRTLKRILRRRYLAVPLVFLVGILGSVLAFMTLEVELFPGEDFPQFYIKTQMPSSYSLQQTSDVLASIEKEVLSLSSSELAAVVTNVGLSTPVSGMESATVSTNVGVLLVELVPKDQRTRTVDEIIRDLRGRVSATTGVEKLTFEKLEGGPPQGRDVEVKVKGERYQELTEIAEKLMDELRGMPGVYDVQNDYTVGKEEFRVRLNAEKARQYGLTVVQLAQMVRGAVDGLTATTYRDVDDAVDVLIKYRPDRMATREDLEAMVVQTPSGEAVPLRSIATIEDARGISEIRRFEGERAVSVFAAVDTSVTSAVAVNDVLINAFADIETLYPGYRLDFRGVFDQINESFADLGKLFIVGILVIYVILGAQFKSFGQPFIIMCAVPFGIMGAMFGLLAVQATLSMVAMFGIVALSGIVVNDSIVLLDFINKYRARGFVRNRAILKAGFVRLRPIILTSMTTIGGLIPMAIGLGGKSPIWMPLASTIIFGMSSATLLTLFMMPALYAILTDMSEWRMRRRQTAQGGTT